MRLLSYRPALLMMILAAPAGAVAAAPPAIPHQASIAAVVLWLAGLGWGFHAMLRHRLAAEDRLAQLETDVVFERDARAAQIIATRQGMQLLAEQWQRLDACLADGDVHHVPVRMHAVQACIAQLQQATWIPSSGFDICSRSSVYFLTRRKIDLVPNQFLAD